MVALGVYRGLQERGVSIPKDVSVIGFDNTYVSRFMNPPLTTVDIPRTELSRIAVEALTARESDMAWRRSRLLRTSLIVRSSTATPPS